MKTESVETMTISGSPAPPQPITLGKMAATLTGLNPLGKSPIAQPFGTKTQREDLGVAGSIEHGGVLGAGIANAPRACAKQ
jgi:hypothetical protein